MSDKPLLVLLTAFGIVFESMGYCAGSRAIRLLLQHDKALFLELILCSKADLFTRYS